MYDSCFAKTYYASVYSNYCFRKWLLNEAAWTGLVFCIEGRAVFALKTQQPPPVQILFSLTTITLLLLYTDTQWSVNSIINTFFKWEWSIFIMYSEIIKKWQVLVVLPFCEDHSKYCLDEIHGTANSLQYAVRQFRKINHVNHREVVELI